MQLRGLVSMGSWVPRNPSILRSGLGNPLILKSRLGNPSILIHKIRKVATGNPSIEIADEAPESYPTGWDYQDNKTKISS